jgi:hypothetical protein
MFSPLVGKEVRGDVDFGETIAAVPDLLIIPPEYFPAPSVLAAALCADRVVLADTYQYVRQSRQNRAAVRSPDGMQWLTIPLEGGQHGVPIDRCRIAERDDWRSRHLKAIRFNYGRSPFYEHFVPDLERLIAPKRRAEEGGGWLSDVTCATAELLLHWLDVASPVVRASALAGRPATLAAIRSAFPDHQPVVTGDRVPSDDPRDVRVVRLDPLSYRQAFDGYQPGLSGLDLLLNLGPDARRLLHHHLTIDPITA